MRKAILSVALGLVLLSTGCGSDRKLIYAFRGQVLDVPYNVQIVGTQRLNREFYQDISQGIQSLLASIFSKVSTELPDSELTLLNLHQRTDAFRVSPEVLEMLDRSLNVAKETGGAFDVTVAPVIATWGFGKDGRVGKIPDRNEIQDLVKRIGWEKLEIDESDSVVRKRVADVTLTLRDVVDGYAVDELSQMLTEIGWADHMVEVGSHVRTRGTNRRGQPWKISIQREQQHDGSMSGLLDVSNFAIAVSGNDEWFIAEDGKYYSQHIDPRTGWPIDHDLLSATVVTDSGIHAGLYSKALVVMGKEDGLKFAEEHKLAALLLVETEDGQIAEIATSQFREMTETPLLASRQVPAETP